MEEKIYIVKFRENDLHKLSSSQGSSGIRRSELTDNAVLLLLTSSKYDIPSTCPQNQLFLASLGRKTQLSIWMNYLTLRENIDNVVEEESHTILLTHTFDYFVVNKLFAIHNMGPILCSQQPER